MVGLNGHKGRICFQFNKTAAAHFSIILHTKVQLPTICGGSSPSWHRSDNWKAKQAKLGKLRRWRSLWPSWRDRTQFRRVDGQIVEMMRTRRKKRELGVVMVKKKKQMKWNHSGVIHFGFEYTDSFKTFEKSWVGSKGHAACWEDSQGMERKLEGSMPVGTNQILHSDNGAEHFMSRHCTATSRFCISICLTNTWALCTEQGGFKDGFVIEYLHDWRKMIRRVVAVVWNCVWDCGTTGGGGNWVEYLDAGWCATSQPFTRPGIAGKPIHIINRQTSSSSVASVTIFNHLSVSAFSVLKIEWQGLCVLKFL